MDIKSHQRFPFGLPPAATWLPISWLLALALSASAAAAESPAGFQTFPPALESYPQVTDGIGATLMSRIVAEPLNLVASIIFLFAILHTFLAPKLLKLSHHWRDQHAAGLSAHDALPSSSVSSSSSGEAAPPNHSKASALSEPIAPVSFRAEVMHFFGEIEAIFGIWVIPLLLILTVVKGWPTTEHYINHAVHFTEPMFVVVIMTIAATRPVLRFAEICLGGVAQLGQQTPGAWWLAILTVGPILGSLITEPAAMTISALLLSRHVYDRKPSPRLAYATIGLLFVNISVGGTLTHFAAPPVLMVAQKWDWQLGFMFTHFGWKAVLGILLANGGYFLLFRKELHRLRETPNIDLGGPETWEDRTDPVPSWVTVVHLLFLGWTVFTAHTPALFIGGFLFFLAFSTATEHHQNRIQLKPALLVGFFLAGLVIHGGLQGWWIEPLLASFGKIPLLIGAAGLTAFNDNAAITYLASLVPNFSEPLKYAVVAGAVAGGGLTVIANAPNPAGQSILAEYFPDGVSPMSLFLGAFFPTLIMIAVFALLG